MDSGLRRSSADAVARGLGFGFAGSLMGGLGASGLGKEVEFGGELKKVEASSREEGEELKVDGGVGVGLGEVGV